jgi:UDP-N-acetylglucosamine 2-epimerase (non-hydrolysing)
VTIDVGSNKLVPSKTDAIMNNFAMILDQPERFGQVPETWDGHAAERIAALLLQQQAPK